MCGVHRPPRGGARLRRAVAPRADARCVTMRRSLTHVGEGTGRRPPRRPSRCTAPETRRAQNGGMAYRADAARLTSEAPSATRGEGGGGCHPPPFVRSLQWGKWRRETGIGNRSSGNPSSGIGYREGSLSGRVVSGATKSKRKRIIDTESGVSRPP